AAGQAGTGRPEGCEGIFGSTPTDIERKIGAKGCQFRPLGRAAPACRRFAILRAMQGSSAPAPAPAGAPAPRTRSLRLLHLEDSEPDHVLALLHLQRAGLRVRARRVETRAQFQAALNDPWDVVLSDYHLPGFTGIDALQLLRERESPDAAHVPFI